MADHTRLVLVGDPHQLPSVGPGNILRELIASGVIPTAELTQIKRQEDGLIVRACQRIKSGQDPVFANTTAGDCFFLERATEEEIRSTLLELVCERLPAAAQQPAAQRIDPLKDLQVLTPVREKTTLSCQALNAALQHRLNPHNPVVEGGRFRVGDKVIQTKNDYALGLMNGDIGLVDAIDTSAHTLTVTFEAPTRTVEVSWFDHRLELAYALTVHKAQGSEARVVVLPLHPAFGLRILQRNWLYTAVSRAQELCVLIGHRAELSKIVHRDGQQRRHTRLAQMDEKRMTVQKPAREPVIVVDTREQKPYRFTRCQVKTLPTGDYSLVGWEDRVAIERKSAADLAGSLGTGRARFRRELERLAQLDYAAIVVEASLKQLLQPPPFSRMHPKAVVNSMLAWSVQYRMPVFFAGDRAHGHAVTYQLLTKYWRYHRETSDARAS